MARDQPLDGLNESARQPRSRKEERSEVGRLRSGMG